MQIAMVLPTAQMSIQKNAFLAMTRGQRKLQGAGRYGFYNMTQSRA